MNNLFAVRGLPLLLGGVVAVLSSLSGAANAQAWPARNITVIVPLAAGTGMDTLVRMYSDQLSKALGKPVIVDNRPGAALMLGVTALSKAPADGYTLGIATAPAMAINPTLYKQVNYDVDKDFTPISLYVKSPFILVISPTMGPRTVPELIKMVKEVKGAYSFSTPGTGAAQHLAVEYMKQKFGLDITHVPYKSSPQSVADIMAGHVSMAFAEAGLALPLIKDGKLRALAVSSSTRLPEFIRCWAYRTGGNHYTEHLPWHLPQTRMARATRCATVATRACRQHMLLWAHHNFGRIDELVFEGRRVRSVAQSDGYIGSPLCCATLLGAFHQAIPAMGGLGLTWLRLSNLGGDKPEAIPYGRGGC